jgi:ribokinase
MPTPRPKITIIGSANVDFTMRVPALPKVGQTVADGSFLQAYGGKGANQAVAAARAGASTAWVGAIGTDALSGGLRDALSAEGLDLSKRVLLPDHSPGTALILCDEAGRNYIAVDAGANGAFLPEHVKAAEALVAASDWVILQMEIPSPANLQALELAAQHKVPVMLNFAPVRDLTFPIDERIHALIVNETEAAALLGGPLSGEDAEACLAGARQLRAKGGHGIVLITLGEWGVVYATAEEEAHLPAFPAKAIDTTAAGDTFCGYLATGLGEGLPLREAARLATAASALAVSRAGAQPSIPHRAEVEASASKT